MSPRLSQVTSPRLSLLTRQLHEYKIYLECLSRKCSLICSPTLPFKNSSSLSWPRMKFSDLTFLHFCLEEISENLFFATFRLESRKLTAPISSIFSGAVLTFGFLATKVVCVRERMFIVWQSSIGQNDDHDDENSWISGALLSRKRKTKGQRGHWNERPT